MSNKSQLQTNNTKVASLIEVLKTKGTPSGEEVTEETNAYTAKLETLETAITALENELDGKAGGGGGGIEYEIVNITDTGVTSIPFTLKRITKTFGLFNGESGSGAPSVGSLLVSAHIDTYKFFY